MSRNPVLLVHGLYDTTAKFDALSAHLSDRGWSVHSLDLTPNDGRGCLKALARQVADYVDRTFDAQQAIDLLGFSMGGLVTRYYLQRLGGVDRVHRYISISAPNRGTLAAYALPWEGIGQMRPQSPFVSDLNRDWQQYYAQLQVTTLWTPFDLMILPAASSCLGSDREISLPVWVHAWMVHDNRTLEIVADALSEPLPESLLASKTVQPA